MERDVEDGESDEYDLQDTDELDPMLKWTTSEPRF
jgi:hypothetical protein